MATSTPRPEPGSGAGADRWAVQPGTAVFGTDDRKIGGVTAIEGQHLIVSSGGFLPRDYMVPFFTIVSHTDDRIDLGVTADDAQTMDWGPAPSTGSTMVPTLAGPSAGDEATTGRTTGAGMTARSDAPQETVIPAERPEAVVQVIEEQLQGERHQVERGAVRVETTVSEHEATLDVAATEERVHVRRVAVDRPATAADLSIQSRTLEVPVYGEDIEVQKQARVVEEVEISKDAIQETREFHDTVQRRDVDVIDESVPRAATGDGTTGDAGKGRQQTT